MNLNSFLPIFKQKLKVQNAEKWNQWKKICKGGILNTQLLIKNTTHKINMLIHMFFLANYLNI